MLISTLLKRIKDQHAENRQPETIRGSCIYRMFHPSERYVVDSAADYNSSGWRQFDTWQDAPYFGVWVNPRTLQTLTYAEGDWSLVECASVFEFNQEIEGLCKFYEEGQITTTFDADGTKTVYRQNRLKFYIPLGV